MQLFKFSRLNKSQAWLLLLSLFLVLTFLPRYADRLYAGNGGYYNNSSNATATNYNPNTGNTYFDPYAPNQTSFGSGNYNNAAPNNNGATAYYPNTGNTYFTPPGAQYYPNTGNTYFDPNTNQNPVFSPSPSPSPAPNQGSYIDANGYICNPPANRNNRNMY